MASEYADLDKLDVLADTSTSSSNTPPPGMKLKSASIQSSLDNLLASLQSARAQLVQGTASPSAIGAQAVKAVEIQKKAIDDRQKDVYNALGRVGKALDKKFPESLPNYSPLYPASDTEAVAAMDRVVASHFIRTGVFNVAETFIAEANLDISTFTTDEFVHLHSMLNALEAEDVGPALEWCASNRDFLRSRSCSLEFNLHRSQFLHLLSNSTPQGITSALSYARVHFPTYYATHADAIKRLMACVPFLPNLATSPYADLISPTIHDDLPRELTREYCTSIQVGVQPPLRVVGDIGAGGALKRIEKGRKVRMAVGGAGAGAGAPAGEGRNAAPMGEWEDLDELPIEIPLPPSHHYHSTFTCPVSKEQATPQNPPMMLTCGHVIAKESFENIGGHSRGGRTKCPYCPVESVHGALKLRL